MRYQFANASSITYLTGSFYFTSRVLSQETVQMLTLQRHWRGLVSFLTINGSLYWQYLGVRALPTWLKQLRSSICRKNISGNRNFRILKIMRCGRIRNTSIRKYTAYEKRITEVFILLAVFSKQNVLQQYSKHIA